MSAFLKVVRVHVSKIFCMQYSGATKRGPIEILAPFTHFFFKSIVCVDFFNVICHINFMSKLSGNMLF